MLLYFIVRNLDFFLGDERRGNKQVEMKKAPSGGNV